MGFVEFKYSGFFMVLGPPHRKPQTLHEKLQSDAEPNTVQGSGFRV